MKNNAIVYGIGGFFVGLLVMWFVMGNMVTEKTSSVSDTTPSVSVMHEMGMGSSMEAMVSSLEGKEGNDFDIAFVQAMIPHHQGAVDMAIEAQKKALHPELKKMADDIIKTQNKEIEMMKGWLKTWESGNK